MKDQINSTVEHLNLILAVMRGQRNNVRIDKLAVEDWVTEHRIPVVIPTQYTCDHTYRKTKTKKSEVEHGFVTYLTLRNGHGYICAPSLGIRKVNGSTAKSTKTHCLHIPHNATGACSYEITITHPTDETHARIEITKHLYSK